MNICKPPAVLAIGALLVAGCAENGGYVRALPLEVPSHSVSHYDAAGRCLSGIIGQSFRSQGQRLLVLIDQLGDQTVRRDSAETGVLSNAGGTVLASIMRQITPTDVVEIPLSMPVYSRLFFEQGVPISSGEVRSLAQQYGANRVIGITGGFTAVDSNRGSLGGGASGSADRDDFSAGVDLGFSSGASRIDLVLTVGDVQRNRSLASIRMTGTAMSKSRSFNGTIEVMGIGGGVSYNNVVVDGLHNVQANLLAAANFWLWSALLPGDAELACLDGTPGLVAQTSTGPVAATSPAVRKLVAYRKASGSERTRLLQLALYDTLGGGVRTNGVFCPSTAKAIKRAEHRLGLRRHGSHEYDDLYERLIMHNEGVTDV